METAPTDLSPRGKIGLAKLGSRLAEADSGSDALVGLDTDNSPVVRADNQALKDDDIKACDIREICPRKAKPTLQHKLSRANCSTFFGWSAVGAIRNAILFYIVPLPFAPGMPPGCY